MCHRKNSGSHGQRITLYEANFSLKEQVCALAVWMHNKLGMELIICKSKRYGALAAIQIAARKNLANIST